MIKLVPGSNAPVAAGLLRVRIFFSPVPEAGIDVSAFTLDTSGKVRSDCDISFYGPLSVPDGSVQMIEQAPGRSVFEIDPSRLYVGAEKVALTATIHEKKASFDGVSGLVLTVGDEIEVQIPTTGMQETSLILGEFYRRQGEWKFRCVAQGFTGGLGSLAKHYGVDIAVPAPAPAPKAPVSLSKVTLDNTHQSINLEETPDGFGEIKVNLNWNRGGGTGLFDRSKSIDLEVGCLYELQDGEKGVVQALGNCFGNLQRVPYIQLMGDDRTGSVTGGKWMHINGDKWSKVRRILIFAFIYRGSPNWKHTDGTVSIRIPGQPEIEVRLNEEGGRDGMCAIAMLENVNGAVMVSRRVDFHQSHAQLDAAYGWGMSWRAGSK